jgi:flagellar biosynthetic protein FliR
MGILPLTYQEFKSFFLILIRVSVIFVMFPFFNARIIPVLTKAGLALIMTIVLFPVVNAKVLEFPDNLWGMGQLVLAELIIGMILALLIQIVFEGVRMMGHMVGFQTGFAITNILDPQSGIQVSIMANMAFWVAMTLFLLLNGHHIILNAMRESFEIVHLGSLSLNKEILQKILQVSADMFVIAVKIGAPATAVLLFTMAAFGLITKFIPQMNIMIVAFPIKIVLGLLFFGVCLSVLLRFMERYLDGLGSLLINTMAWMRV